MLLDAQKIVEKSEELSPHDFNEWVRGYVRELVITDFKADAPDEEFYEAHVSNHMSKEFIQRFADRIVMNIFDDMGGSTAYSSSLMMLEYIYMLDPEREYFRDKLKLSPLMRQLTVALATIGTLMSFSNHERYLLWSGWWDAYHTIMSSLKQMDLDGHFDPVLFTKEDLYHTDNTDDDSDDGLKTITELMANGVKKVSMNEVKCWNGVAKCTCTPIYFDLKEERFTQFMVASAWELGSWVCPKCIDALEPADQLIDNMGKGRWMSARSLQP